MKLWSMKNLTGAGALIVAMMAANFLNFLFNAILGRQLSYENFGHVIFYNSILNLAGIGFSALSATLNHRVAYLNGKYEEEAGSLFMRFVRRKAAWVGLGISILWILFAYLITTWFNLGNVLEVMLFSPVFVLAMVTAVNRGYLQGNLLFVLLGITMVAEPLIKLLSASAFMFLKLDHYVYLSIPIALFGSFILASLFVLRKTRTHRGENVFRFPKRFYLAALITGLSSAAFLTVDVVLAKHYLDPAAAGQYAMLALIGSMVYFGGSILNGFMITFVSHDEGENANPLRTFYWLMLGSFILTSCAFLVVGVFGFITTPLLFGAKAAGVVPYLVPYTFAVGLFTLCSAVISYHLAREHYSFSGVVLIIPLILVGEIFRKHGSIADIANAYLIASIIGAVVILVMHLLQRNGRFILGNLVGLVGVFWRMETQKPLSEKGKRILILNWRDLKHKNGGGAEVYVHELAKRWVEGGHQVTLFCGNDGMNPANETIEGVRIVRRGGFYFVYFWAFVYYITRFRGKFDIILDCHNGLPFFTPLYAKEKIYSLVHHVHQKVFYKYLPLPMAALAAVLENRLMPYVYRNIQFITISESTKKDMQDLDLIGTGIDIQFPGVNLKQLKPGNKTPAPTVLYLGRLQPYKSVDVLIQAFRKVAEKISDAVLVIAGSGEDELRLKRLAAESGLAEKIEFKGKVSDDDKTRLLQESWVLVNPSMMEGWGITSIEANAAGTPVVASDVPGLRDSVNNPHTGFLVEYGDSEKFAEKITLLLQNHELRAEMSVSGVAWAQNFDWDKSSENFLSLLTR